MSTNLKLLRRGETGTGILIEHDAGFIRQTNCPFINEMKKTRYR
jgi:hypothetical protein